MIVTPLAERDIEVIGDYIAQDNPRRAISFVRELFAQCKTIAENPPGYRLRPELADDLRSCAYGNYMIFFNATEQEVTIIRVLHGARDIPGEFTADQ
nr:type II toxin-antitoxin system RelE/ParE family toxin [Methylomonas sp. WSC-7]